MHIVALKSPDVKDQRSVIHPDTVGKIVDLEGVTFSFESGIGDGINISDQTFINLGLKAISRDECLSKGNLIITPTPLTIAESGNIQSDSTVLGMLNPFYSGDELKALNQLKINAVSMEFIPRITRAQKMDVLSSQASIAGYAAVVVASEVSDKMFPMMMTPAGTISPARVFVIGAGVAGLQAIATAKRMGARVDAFDTRPVVKEQVESLGAKFVEIDLGDTGQTKDGYAQSLSEEQLARQREAMKLQCAQSDVVITTAQLFGRAAPVIINDDILDAMKPGSVIVDLAAETGGNVVGSLSGEIIRKGNVSIVGASNFAGRYARDASQMYASNLYGFFSEFYSPGNQALSFDPSDEILAACYLVREGVVIHPSFNKSI